MPCPHYKGNHCAATHMVFSLAELNDGYCSRIKSAAQCYFLQGEDNAAASELLAAYPATRREEMARRVSRVMNSP